MELWRVVGAVAIGSGGLILVLIAMAQARDSAVRPRMTRHEGRAARVAMAAGISGGLVLLAVLGALTVLPSAAVWAMVAIAWLLLLALFVVG